jgi:hypothetical protein
VLPESCTLYSEAPIAVARMHSPAGSSACGSRPAAMRRRARSEPPPEVEEVALLAPVDVFADAAGEHHARDARDRLERIGEPQRLHRLRRGLLRQRADERVGHPAATRRARPRSTPGPATSRARRSRELLAGGIEAREASFGIHDREAPADVDRGGVHDLALLHQRELGRAAADVDVEDRRPRSWEAFAAPEP